MIFQRLRYIRQLSFAEFSFPGAVHSRFLHSLGVCHLAGRVFDTLSFLKKFLPPKKLKEFKTLIRVTALVHDLGHGPLSHSSEIIMPLLVDLSVPFFSKSNKQATHEHYTIKFILDSQITNLIKEMGIEPQLVAHLINDVIPIVNKDFFIVKGVDFKPMLKQIISSNLDVDRIDYLQRDSFFCGTEYGLSDHEWILNNFCIYIKNNQAFIGVDQKAFYSIENFFIGRRHMGLAIYFHSKMVIMDQMLMRYFKSEDCDFRIPVCLNKYTECTDSALLENLRSHNYTNEWASRIIQHTPYTQIYEVQYTDNTKKDQLKKICRIKHFLTQHNILFIELNSLDYVNQWYFKHNPHYPLCIVDEHKNITISLKKRLEIFNQDPLIIYRIYISPENKSKYQKELSNFFNK